MNGHPHTARNELMRSNPHNARGRFVRFGSPQAGLQKYLRHEFPPPTAPAIRVFPCSIFLKIMGKSLARPKMALVGSTSKNQTVPKLKLISRFADMGKDRAQAIYKCIFINRPNSWILWLGGDM